MLIWVTMLKTRPSYAVQAQHSLSFRAPEPGLTYKETVLSLMSNTLFPGVSNSPD